jgi:hypothetical protein
MKKSLILFFILLNSSIIGAQVQMDVIEMSISQLKKGSNQKKITNGKDTTTIAIISSGEIDSPFIEIEARLKNISDSALTLYPNESDVYITYFFDNKLYEKKLSFGIKQDRFTNIEKMELKPNQEFCILSSGYIGAFSLIGIKFNMQHDNTINIVKILPTLKYHYKDKSGLKVVHQDVFNVKVLERPSSSSDFIIPSGYYIIPD